MLTIFVILPFLLQAGRQVDRVCQNNYCRSLVIQQGEVRLVETTPNRDLVLGRYLEAEQRFVQKNEAPLASLQSGRGWHIVIASFLDRVNDRAAMKVHFLAPDGRLAVTEDVLMVLDDADVGNLFGDKDEVLAITSNEEHAYNAETSIWLLLDKAKPKLLLRVKGVIEGFIRAGREHGVWIDRQTYDGVNPLTKQHVREFWKWNAGEQTLTLRP